jgi:predicted ATPase
VFGLSFAAWVLWHLGYPDQALKRSQEALALAQELAYPFVLAAALNFAALLHQYRREWHLAQERAEPAITLAIEQGFPLWVTWGTMLRGWALSEQGEEGIIQIRQGLADLGVMEAKLSRTYFLTLLVEGCGKAGRTEEGLAVLVEALATMDGTGERYYEAELYRLKGMLTLQSKVQGQEENQKAKGKVQKAKIETDPRAEAEACFLKAIEIAQRQQAKSLELRAVMSLVRLRQQQATQLGSRTTQHETRTRLDEAHQMLAEVYHWFTEGFDTKDLQEAQALLEELNH